jgi:methylmalonyl-CoA epimerase
MTKIHHIGIAVHDAEQAKTLYEEALGLAVSQCEVVSEQGVTITCLPIGDSEIEFLEPLDDTSPVAKFLATRGEGIHHVCIEVENIRESMARLARGGARLLCDEPMPGAGGCKVAFVHPKSMNGVLLELSQSPGLGED